MNTAGHKSLSTRELVVGYDGNGILPPIDLTIERGSIWVVLGRNGAGKTSWMRTVLGLLPAVSGQVTKAPGTRLAYVPQRQVLDPIVPVRAADVVAMGAEHGLSFLKPFGKVLREKVTSALAEMGIDDLSNKPFRDLSEGQKQKVLLARCIAGGPDIVFLDEPMATMDIVAEREVLGLIQDLRQRRGTTVVIVAHHLQVAANLADGVLFVDKDAQTVCAGTPREVFEHSSFRHRYGDLAMGLFKDMQQ